jgi:DNA-binding transcriptional LysR family regulator
MNAMHIEKLDLNLLRLFDAVFRARSVSRAAEALGLTQPAASHGLTRLRLLLGDALFTRTPGGVAPTPRAERLAVPVQAALAMLQQALAEPERFDPATSRKLFRIHMSDIGEGRFLPVLMARLRELAPGVRVETMPLATGDIAVALDSGRVDFAFGFLPKVKDTQRAQLLKDRYIVLLRKGHPFAKRRRNGQALLDALQELDYVAVRTHADTLRILQLLNLEDRVRLTTEHFMVLPAIVRATDLAVVMPRNIARGFAEEGGYAIVEPPFPLRDFTVSLHWSKRFEADPANHWLRQVITALFSERTG